MKNQNNENIIVDEELNNENKIIEEKSTNEKENDNIKKLIDDLNISVETYQNFLKNELETYKKEQSENINQLNNKIEELNKLLEPNWQSEEQKIQNEKPKNNYNAFWKGE